MGEGTPIAGDKMSPKGATATPEESSSLEGLFENIDVLSHQNRKARDPQIERRLMGLRHRAGLELTGRPAADLEYPTPDFDQLPDGSGLAEVAPDELTPGLLRAAILRRGCLLIRGLVDPGQATRLVDGIDRAFEAREQPASGRAGRPRLLRRVEVGPPVQPGRPARVGGE